MATPADAASAAGTLVDGAAQLAHEVPVVAASWSRALWDWLVNVKRSRIIRFARDRYPEEFSELEGSDVRILDSFLDPSALSNTASLLSWPIELRAPWLPCLEEGSELHLGLEPASLVRYLRDTGGPLAPYGNSQVLGSAGGAERWFFVNGIMTNRDLALRNAARLRALFRRDVVPLYNSTQGLVPDLVASALQKFTNINTEPVAFALVQIGKALLDPHVERVVVIAHSRGTVITGDVLDLIYCAIDERYFDRTNMNERDFEIFQQKSFKTAQAYEVREVLAGFEGREDAVVEKLELYMFANAASKTCYLDEERRRPHIESFANEHDIVARLGCLARDEFHAQKLLRIDGAVYMRPGQYGHLLNAHYLRDVERGVYAFLAPPRSPEPCVGDLVHERVVANPCARNPAWKGPTVASPSRLLQYLGNAEPSGKPRPGRARARAARTGRRAGSRR